MGPMSGVYCAKCEAANPSDAAVCSLCGHELQRPETHEATPPKHSRFRSPLTRFAILGLALFLVTIGVVFVAVREHSAGVESARMQYNRLRLGELEKPIEGVITNALSQEQNKQPGNEERTPNVGNGNAPLHDKPEQPRQTEKPAETRPGIAISQEKFERLYRVAKKIKIAIQPQFGHNVLYYGETTIKPLLDDLLPEFTLEYDIAKDKCIATCSQRESTMLREYLQALDAFHDLERVHVSYLMTQIEAQDRTVFPIDDLQFATRLKGTYGVDYSVKDAFTVPANGRYYVFPPQFEDIILKNAIGHIDEGEHIYLGATNADYNPPRQ